jgi:Fic family protein
VDLSAFSGSSPGQLVPISGIHGRTGETYDHAVFFPDPLPETLVLGGAAWEAVALAMQALGRADLATRKIPNPGLLRRPSLRREAQSTSALEGTHAVLSEVLEADAGGRAMTPEIREVLNYAEMAEAAIEAVATRPITFGQLCEWQAMLVRGTSSDGPESGKVRDSQVVIGPKHCLVEEARFVPPPPGDLLVTALREWVDWVERARSMPVAVQAALAHYQFETLHPFHDGNGRIGRLVIVLQLIRKGDLRDGLLTISPWLEARRDEYQGALLRLSQTGDWDHWVTFFSRALTAASEATVERIERLLAFQAYVRDLVHTRKPPIRGTAIRIAEDLIGNPVITVKSTARRYDVTYQAANNAISRLVGAEILVEATGRSYDRIFFAPQVIRILEL